MKGNVTLLFFVAVGCANGYMLGSQGTTPAGAQTTAPGSTSAGGMVTVPAAQLKALEDRIAALESKTQDMIRGVSSDGKVPYIQFNARLGVFTNYWCKKPL